MVNPALTLYANPKCPFARRAMLAAAEKAVETSMVWIPLSGQLKKMRDDPSYAEAAIAEMWPGKTVDELFTLKEKYKIDVNASGEVPTLNVTHPSGDDFIAEADVVAEYLEDAFPSSGVPLFPGDALLRSKIRHYHKVLSGPTGVAAMYGLLTNQDPEKDEALRDKLYSGLAKFVSMSSNEGPYFLGNTFSFADVMLMPMFDQFRYALPHYRGVEFIPSDGTTYPWAARMQQWADAVEKRDSFGKVAQGKDVYVAMYAGYAGQRGVSKFGQ